MEFRCRLREGQRGSIDGDQQLFVEHVEEWQELRNLRITCVTGRGLFRQTIEPFVDVRAEKQNCTRVVMARLE